MKDIDVCAVKAKLDKECCESLILEFEPFILHAAHKVTGSYISKSDDQWSVSLLAFHEAIQCYSYDKGMFIPFAELVIRRRLYDYIKKQSRHIREIPVNPVSFGNDSGEEENMFLRQQILKKISVSSDDSAKLEIQALSAVLQEYGFSFFDLLSASPKTDKTKAVCAKAVLFLLENTDLTKEMRNSRTLPLKKFELELQLPRKILERHRKYIITAIEILEGDYPILSEYLKSIKEVQA